MQSVCCRPINVIFTLNCIVNQLPNALIMQCVHGVFKFHWSTHLINIQALSNSKSRDPLSWSFTMFTRVQDAACKSYWMHVHFFWARHAFRPCIFHDVSPTKDAAWNIHFHVSFDTICRPITRVLCIMDSEEFLNTGVHILLRIKGQGENAMSYYKCGDFQK